MAWWRVGKGVGGGIRATEGGAKVVEDNEGGSYRRGSSRDMPVAVKTPLE